MAIFHYTVANREGKQLSGTVEAPNEETARKELNNLGFSIFSLKETTEKSPETESKNKYVFEALDKYNRNISGSIPATTQDEAFKKLLKEYSLTVTAIWPKNATESEITAAKKRGTEILKQQLKIEEEKEEKNKQKKDLARKKQEQFVKTKIEYILDRVNDLLLRFDKELDKFQKNEINKRINKVLRIKNSKNLDYILVTAEDLLKYIQEQEKELKKKGYKEKEFELKVNTKKLLDELHREPKSKSFSEDVVDKIEKIKDKYKEKKENFFYKNLRKFLDYIKKLFQTPPEIKAIKEKISSYNKQLFEYAKLYFKEPTPEYRQKVKSGLKSIWQARKKAKKELKIAKKNLKQKVKVEPIKENLYLSFIEELNSLSGWLIAFYLIYYFISLYISTKDFGLKEIPQGFMVYETQIFKYILVILFLLHSSTTLKINFLQKNKLADFILIPCFLIGSILVILNF